MQVYFDNAATTPLHPKVLEKMLPFLKEDFGNPSSIHSFGRNNLTNCCAEMLPPVTTYSYQAERSPFKFNPDGRDARNNDEAIDFEDTNDIPYRSSQKATSMSKKQSSLIQRFERTCNEVGSNYDKYE